MLISSTERALQAATTTTIYTSAGIALGGFTSELAGRKMGLNKGLGVAHAMITAGVAALLYGPTSYFTNHSFGEHLGYGLNMIATPLISYQLLKRYEKWMYDPASNGPKTDAEEHVPAYRATLTPKKYMGLMFANGVGSLVQGVHTHNILSVRKVYKWEKADR